MLTVNVDALATFGTVIVYVDRDFTTRGSMVTCGVPTFPLALNLKFDASNNPLSPVMPTLRVTVGSVVE